MTKRTMAAVASATLGLTLLGAGAASASTGTSPVDWAQHMARHAGVGAPAGVGDPTLCPNYDGTADSVQLRTRDRLMDPDADHDVLQQQTRDRIHVDLAN